MTDVASERDPRLTRRRALGAAAGAGAVSLLRPFAGAASMASPLPPSVFSAVIGSLPRGVSRPFAAPREFQLVGVEWTSPARARIELRSRHGGGRFGPWAPASVLGHGPDRPARPHPFIGEGVWTGPANQVELRCSHPLHGVRLRYVGVDAHVGDAHTASFPLARPVLNAGPGQPPIIARRAWGQGHALPAVPPSYGEVKLAFVHHTVNPNGYSAGEVPAMLFAIYQYHRFARGFDDIAYNFVIDLFGRIWEARAGGIDQPVVGAQAGGYNLVSTGIAVLGTFTDVLPTQAALGAVERTVAWKLSLHGAPTSGHVTVVVDPKDYFYTPFGPGAHVSLPRVAGHRDGDLTDCPGNALYGHLSAMRPRIDALAGHPLRLTLSAPRAEARAGAPATVSGRLAPLRRGAGITGAAIEVQRIAGDGRGTTIQTATTGDRGAWTASLILDRNVTLQAVRRARPAAISVAVDVAVAPVITLSVGSAAPLRVSGAVHPAKRHVTIDVYTASGRRRRLIASKRATVSGPNFAATIWPRGRGPFEVIARTAPDAQNAAGASAAVKVA